MERYATLDRYTKEEVRFYTIAALIEILLFWKHWLLADTANYPALVALVWLVSAVNSSALTMLLIMTRQNLTVQYKIGTAALIVFSGALHAMYTDTLGLVQIVVVIALGFTLYEEYAASKELEHHLRGAGPSASAVDIQMAA